jgi:WD40 repeat protein
MSVVMHVSTGVPLVENYINIPTPNRTFHQVGGKFLERMDVVTEIFNRVLQPLYGSQEKAIKQIQESTDRKCFLLYEEALPVAVLVFKTVLSSEFEKFGVKDSIEIKSLFVDQSTQNSGRGLGSALIDRLQQEVSELGLRHSGIHVTVSDKKQESLMFFRKKNFQIVHEWKGKYQPDSVEFLLSCPAKIKEAEEKKVAEVENSIGKLSLGQVERLSAKKVAGLLCVIPNAHLDDIHALKRLSDGTFVSASKDNSMYKWNTIGERVRTVYEVEPTQRNERDWGTALEVINAEYWVSGERSGRISLWKTNGTYVKDIQPKLPKQGSHVSNKYNSQRITCFANGLNTNKPSFFVGLPTMFDEFNFIEGRTEFSTKVHSNDWVYAICPLQQKKILIVTGCNVDVWSKDNDRWNHSGNLISEVRQSRTRRSHTKPQRPFISSLVPLNSSKELFGLSIFDGSVKVLDIVQKTVVLQWKEHKGRVWAIESITPQLFASSGEDRTIKFWDTRSKKSVYTIPDHIGQVSAMLSWDQHTLIAGTCPEDAVSNNQGAEIRIYDVRR